jgi:hypothetical protein
MTPHEGSASTVEDGGARDSHRVLPAARLCSPTMTGRALVLPPPRS